MKLISYYNSCSVHGRQVFRTLHHHLLWWLDQQKVFHRRSRRRTERRSCFININSWLSSQSSESLVYGHRGSGGTPPPPTQRVVTSGWLVVECRSPLMIHVSLQIQILINFSLCVIDCLLYLDTGPRKRSPGSSAAPDKPLLVCVSGGRWKVFFGGLSWTKVSLAQ